MTAKSANPQNHLPANIKHRLDVLLIEDYDDHQLLNVHLDDGLADERGAKEGPEGDERVAADDARQVKERIGNGGTGEDAEEAHPLHEVNHVALHRGRHRLTAAIGRRCWRGLVLVRLNLGGAAAIALVFRLRQLRHQVLQLLKLLEHVVLRVAGEAVRPRDKVGRQLAEGRPRPPHERLQADLRHDRPDGDGASSGCRRC